MNDSTTTSSASEPMIDAKQAAAALRLPYYWFADHGDAHQVPDSALLDGGLVRYRLSELSAWAARSAAAQSRDGEDGNASVGVVE